MQGQGGSGGADLVHWNLGSRSGEVFVTKAVLLHPKKHMVLYTITLCNFVVPKHSVW